MEYIGWLEDDNKLIDEDAVVIYGAGKYGKRAYSVMKEKGWENKIKAFCVSEESAAGGEIEGIRVVPVKIAAEKYKGACYLIASVAVREMIESLKVVGITENIHIVKV